MIETANEIPMENGRGSLLQRCANLKAHKFVLALTCVNLLAVGFILSRSGWDKPVIADAPQTPAIVRAQAIELVNERGQVRSRLNVEPSGEVVFRLFDKDGTIRVKLGASEDGSGLLLLDETTEPAVHLLARSASTSAKLNTTRIVLKSGKGEPRVIKP